MSSTNKPGAVTVTMDGQPEEPAEAAAAPPPATDVTLTMSPQLHAISDEALAGRLVEPPPVGQWDRYELCEMLGRGGMGAVYKARDKRLDRFVAIKFILSADPRTTMRFLQEARAQARIDHPNVCKVLEVGEVEGKAYIAMQLVEGASLGSAAGAMTFDEKAEVMKTVADAMQESHRLGIIHRDIKPSNIMVERIAEADGSTRLRPVLMDFGLAREAGDTRGLTESGAVMGTPSYMSPEQARGDVRHVDHRSDVYSLGATLYDLLAGVPPFVDDSTANILLKVLISDPPPLRSKAPSVPDALEVIVDKCLHKEPHRRYQSARELSEDLGRFLGRRRLVARRQGLASRLYWRGRRNKPMAMAVISLFVLVLGFIGYGVRTAIVSAQKEAIARKRAQLAQKLGTAVKDLEWLVRSAYLVPLHDTGPEKAVVRGRMAEIESEMRSFGDLAAGLDHYALGRGHLALQEWDKAHEHLSKAEAEGVREPELDYALGRVLGELYRRALEDARKSGDKSYFERRKKELEQQYLAPALAHLEKSRGLKTISADYIDALILFYHRRYDEALAVAGSARRGTSWLYEAAKLEGDVYMARALDAKDRGDNDEAEKYFAQAVTHYELAADIGRSDHQIYEALAEAWVRQEELDMYRGRDPGAKLEKALSAADKALTAGPRESYGNTKKAFAHHFQAIFAQRHGAPKDVVERLYQAQIAAGQKAIALHPEDAYAHETTGTAYMKLAGFLLDQGQPAQPLFDQAFAHLQEAIRINPKFPWAYNDYGLALGFAASGARRRNEDPRPLLKKAIETTQKATQIDDQYVIGFGNTAGWLNELAEWQVDHGEDPEETVREAVRMADRAIKINKKYPPAYTNSGAALARVAAYRLDTGEDGREPARLAIDRFKARLDLDQRVVMALFEMARTYHLLASHERALGIDPQPSLDAGLRTLEQCYRVDASNADCRIVEAQLRAAQGQWLRQQGRPFDVAFEQAQRLAREATEKIAGRADLWLLLGQVSLERADALFAARRPPAAPGAVIDEGIRAVEQSMRRAPGFPRTLAVDGALHLRKARMETDPARKRAALERARAGLSEAFAGNPLLKRRYGGDFAEAERLLK